jgi:lysophospholipase L1-like esterase
MMKRLRFALAFLLFVAVETSTASDPTKEVWVGSWATSPVLMPMKDGGTDRTFRSVAHLSLGGTAIRIALTNKFGTTPLRIDSAHVALSAGTGKVADVGRVQSSTDHPLLFNHQPSVTIPTGSFVLSDPVPMAVSSFADVAISIYIPEQTVAAPTCHPWGLSKTYTAAGDKSGETELRTATTITSTCFLQSVIVRAEDKNSAAVVALGDSITDGAYSTLDKNSRYPDVLAARLHANKETAHLAVLNEGIAGGRVLYDGHGPNVLARFDSDALEQPGVRYVIYMEGINDIGQILKPDSPEKDLAVSDLIFAATQLVARAHQHGVKVIGGTVLAFGAKDTPATPQWLRVRQVISQYNDWVRNSHAFDAVADFNKATADPQAPDTLLPAFDHGDHTHPNDAGYKAMADAVRLDDFLN